MFFFLISPGREINFTLLFLKPGIFDMRTWCSCMAFAPNRGPFILWLSSFPTAVCWHTWEREWTSSRRPSSCWRCAKTSLRAWPISSPISSSTETWWEPHHTRLSHRFWKITSVETLLSDYIKIDVFGGCVCCCCCSGCQELFSGWKWHSQGDRLWNVKVRLSLVFHHLQG